MVEFRPHKLELVRSEGSYDENGDFIPGSDSVVLEAPCRYEPNGKANSIVLDDGNAYVYSYTIYVDINWKHNFKVGDRIRLYDKQGNRLAGEFTIKGFHRGQLNEKIWV